MWNQKLSASKQIAQLSIFNCKFKAFTFFNSFAGSLVAGPKAHSWHTPSKLSLCGTAIVVIKVVERENCCIKKKITATHKAQCSYPDFFIQVHVIPCLSLIYIMSISVTAPKIHWMMLLDHVLLDVFVTDSHATFPNTSANLSCRAICA